MIEYAPAPPFGIGTPEASTQAVRDQVLLARDQLIRRAREKSERIETQMRDWI